MPLASCYLTGIKGKAPTSSALISVYLRAIIHAFFYCCDKSVDLLFVPFFFFVFFLGGGVSHRSLDDPATKGNV